MQVERSRIPPEGLDLSFLEEPRWEGIEGLWITLAPVEAFVHLERSGGGILARGTFVTTAVVPCSRCSESVSVPISDQFEVLYMGEADTARGGDIDLTTEEMDIELLRDDRLDLSGLLRENVLLSLPLQPLCRAECRGLCAHCGVNLNETSCECGVRGPDPRLRSLQYLR